MKTKIRIGQLFCALTLTASIMGCSSSDKKVEAKGDTVANVAPTTPVEKPALSKEAFAEFDWTSVPQSTAEIGEFPYLTAPSGFIIRRGSSSDESKTGYSELKT